MQTKAAKINDCKLIMFSALFLLRRRRSFWLAALLFSINIAMTKLKKHFYLQQQRRRDRTNNDYFQHLRHIKVIGSPCFVYIISNNNKETSQAREWHTVRLTMTVTSVSGGQWLHWQSHRSQEGPITLGKRPWRKRTLHLYSTLNRLEGFKSLLLLNSDRTFAFYWGIKMHTINGGLIRKI